MLAPVSQSRSRRTLLRIAVVIKTGRIADAIEAIESIRTLLRRYAVILKTYRATGASNTLMSRRAIYIIRAIYHRQADATDTIVVRRTCAVIAGRIADAIQAVMTRGALGLVGTRIRITLRTASTSDTNEAVWAFAVITRTISRSTLKLRNTDTTDTIGTLWAHIIGSTSREAMITEAIKPIRTSFRSCIASRTTEAVDTLHASRAISVISTSKVRQADATNASMTLRAVAIFSTDRIAVSIEALGSFWALTTSIVVSGWGAIIGITWSTADAIYAFKSSRTCVRISRIASQDRQAETIDTLMTLRAIAGVSTLLIAQTIEAIHAVRASIVSIRIDCRARS